MFTIRFVGPNVSQVENHCLNESSILKLKFQDAKQELDETWDYNFEEHQQFQKNGCRNVNKVTVYNCIDCKQI